MLPVTVATLFVLLVAIEPPDANRASVTELDVPSSAVNVKVNIPNVLDVVAAVVFFIYPEMRYNPDGALAARSWEAVMVADWFVKSIAITSRGSAAATAAVANDCALV